MLFRSRKVNIVHCPRSHAYFRHGPFPLRRLANAGVNVCLGTDSLASLYNAQRSPLELNMFQEMRALASSQPWLSARRILEMATLNGARAIGMKGRVGQLSPGAFADLITIPFAGKASEVHDAVLGHKGDVTASMIHGQWEIAPEGAS